MTQDLPRTPILLYDGTCGFCAWSVQLVLRHDRRQTLRFASLQGDYGTAVRSRHADLAGVDSIVWVEPDGNGETESVAVRSEAALRVARYLGGWWTLGLAGRLIPRPDSRCTLRPHRPQPTQAGRRRRELSPSESGGEAAVSRHPRVSPSRRSKPAGLTGTSSDPVKTD